MMRLCSWPPAHLKGGASHSSPAPVRLRLVVTRQERSLGAAACCWPTPPLGSVCFRRVRLTPFRPIRSLSWRGQPWAPFGWPWRHLALPFDRDRHDDRRCVVFALDELNRLDFLGSLRCNRL